MAVTSHKESSVECCSSLSMVSPVWGNPPGPPHLCRGNLSECEPERTSHMRSPLLSSLLAPGPTLSSSVPWGEAATLWAAPSHTGLPWLVNLSNSCIQVADTFHSNIDSFSQDCLYQYTDISFANVLYVFVLFSDLLRTWGRKKDSSLSFTEPVNWEGQLVNLSEGSQVGKAAKQLSNYVSAWWDVKSGLKKEDEKAYLEKKSRKRNSNV